MRTPKASYANVMSTIAVFLALGGVGWAATTLPRNSVGTQQLRTGAVHAVDVRTGAITSAKVKDKSLLAKDFKAGQLPKGATGAAGAPGPQGPQGAPGPKGDPGAPGAAAGTEALYGSLGATVFAPDLIVASFAPTSTTAPGRLLVSVTVDRDITCASTFRAAITVDDKFVSGSQHRFDVGANPDVLVLSGVTTDAVAAGAHVVKVIGDCDGIAGSQNSIQFATYNAVVLGA